MTSKRVLSVLYMGTFTDKVKLDDIIALFNDNQLSFDHIMFVEGCYAFVDCLTEENANKAIEKLNGISFCGRRLRVELSIIYKRIGDTEQFWKLEFRRATNGYKSKGKYFGGNQLGGPHRGMKPRYNYWYQVPINLQYAPMLNDYDTSMVAPPVNNFFYACTYQRWAGYCPHPKKVVD